jgi:deoxycytidylate deaminase
MYNFEKFFESKDTDIVDLQNFFLETIFNINQSSVAKRLQVGAIFVKNNSIIGMGYNHTPFDKDQSCQVQKDGNLVSKPWIHFTEDKDGVIHAEIDCMRRMKLNNIPTQDSSVYVTDACCIDCAKELVKASVKEVFYVRPYRITDGIDFLKSNGVKVVQLQKN